MNLRFLRGKKIPSDTPLWRYMGLGAFFYLLQQNKVYVPSLKKLEEADPKEMRIRQHSVTGVDPFVRSKPFQHARGWLKSKHLSRTGFDVDGSTSGRSHQDQWLIDEWIHQLGVRRCAWCLFSPGKPPANWMESMAMWNLYARNGVAIKTTLERIIAAFREQELKDLLVAEVEYCRQGGSNMRFWKLEYAKRPFLIKSASYRHENEVRLVFHAAVQSGLKVNLDAKTLLERGEVIISPFLVPDEAAALIEVAKGLLPGVTVNIHASSERASSAPDPTHSLDWEEEIERLSEPFRQEPDLPDLLREL